MASLAPPTSGRDSILGSVRGCAPPYSNLQSSQKGLLIGINYTRQYGRLRGCVDDVRSMAAYLVEHCGYRTEDMVILTDDRQGAMSRPTKLNILRAMHWLVKGAAPNDSLFFHYSGHGVQGGECDNDGPDGFDTSIYPVDCREHGCIAYDEMQRIMVQPLQPGVALTAIFDSYCPDTYPDLSPAVEGTKTSDEKTSPAGRNQAWASELGPL